MTETTLSQPTGWWRCRQSSELWMLPMSTMWLLAIDNGPSLTSAVVRASAMLLVAVLMWSRVGRAGHNLQPAPGPVKRARIEAAVWLVSGAVVLFFAPTAVWLDGLTVVMSALLYAKLRPAEIRGRGCRSE